MALKDTKELAQAGGYRVEEDVDQAGKFVWIRDDADGKAAEGCECSHPSAAEAWLDAACGAVGYAMACDNLSDEQWESKSHRDQVEAIKKAYGFDEVSSVPVPGR